jgi:hypothetical protein
MWSQVWKRLRTPALGLLDANKEFCPEVNAEKTEYSLRMFMSHHQIAGQNHNTKLINVSKIWQSSNTAFTMKLRAG